MMSSNEKEPPQKEKREVPLVKGKCMIHISGLKYGGVKLFSEISDLREFLLGLHDVCRKRSGECMYSDSDYTMGLTKQYLRYATAGTFNIVGSSRAGIELLDLKDTKGRYCAVGACEQVIVWDVRKGEKMFTLSGEKSEVTCLAACPRKRHLAVGYNNGVVCIFDLYSGECTVNFSGHKSSVTALNYDRDGMRLVSGAKDTDVIVWDIVNESGLYRLRGHKGVITQARFLSQHNILVTSSKDTFIKFWDMDTQHCFRTLVGHTSEVWDFVIAKNESRIITGSADMELRVWEIVYLGQAEESSEPDSKKPRIEAKSEMRLSRLTEDDDNTDDENDDDEHKNEDIILTCRRLGTITRQGRDRVVSLGLDSTGRVLGCHGNDSLLEVFRIQTDEEINKNLQKRQKKARKRAREAGGGDDTTLTLSVEDEIRRVTSVKMSGKVRAFSAYLENESIVKLLSLLTNNTVQTCTVDLTERKGAASNVTKLSLPGHRTDVRTLCFSSDNTAMLSASAECVKIWNRATLQCIRTMKCDYALCSIFAPGDRHVVIGTKSGKLQIFDIAAGILLESVDAHTDTVWSVALAPDKRSLVSGSADHEVKFWDFELISDEEYSTTSKRLSLVHTRTLKMTESVLCLKYSSDFKFLAVSLLDNTVKVFFADTLKFFLSLYGHKLPVLCLDISSDNSLIATGSADRNVKLWGLDFGDCHKSIFAHDDSIMCLQFVPKTHLFFTGGKDGKIKQWDADSFEHILTLQGHHSEVWCIAVSPSGNFLVSGSHDKSLRLWEKTQEPLILDEEREMEREKEHDESVGQGEESVIAGETNKEATLPGKKTIETVRAAERLMEAINIYQEETEKLEEYEDNCKTAGKQLPAPPLHPMFQAFGVTTPIKYVLEVLKKIKSSELEEALLVLPFSYVSRLLEILHLLVESSLQVELVCRCLFFLLRVHQGQITSSQLLLPVLDKLRKSTLSRVHQIRDTIGFNLAGLRFLKQQIEEKEQVMLFADATDRFKQKKKKEKKKAILTLKV